MCIDVKQKATTHGLKGDTSLGRSMCSLVLLSCCYCTCPCAWELPSKVACPKIYSKLVISILAKGVASQKNLAMKLECSESKKLQQAIHQKLKYKILHHKKRLKQLKLEKQSIAQSDTKVLVQ